MSGELKNLCVVLVGTRNPLNVGAVARAMSNFGAMELRAVRPYEKAWREARSAVGAGELLARAKEFTTLGSGGGLFAGGGYDGGGKSRDEASFARIGRGRAADREADDDGAGGGAFWIGEVGIVE